MDAKIVRRALVDNFLEVMNAIPAGQGVDSLMTVLFLIACIIESEEEMTLIGLMSREWPEIHEMVRERLRVAEPGLFN